MVKAGRRLYVLTLTAPGSDPSHLRWDPGWIRGTRPHCGCTAHLPTWNADAGKAWNRFATTMRREHPGVQFFRATEIQEQRGAIHYHIPLTVPEDQVLDVLLIQRWAMAAGFGCTLHLDDRPRVERLAGYVAKYVTKGSSERDRVPWQRDQVDQATGEVRRSHRPTYRNWSSSKRWGLTMRDCKAASAHAARIHAHLLREDVKGSAQALTDARHHRVPDPPPG